MRLVPDVLQNVTASGLVVLGDAGFAPDAEGFTLLVAAAAPGAVRGLRPLRADRRIRRLSRPPARRGSTIRRRGR